MACAILGAAGAACADHQMPTQPSYGFLEIDVNTTGQDLDVDGYDVMLDERLTALLKNPPPAYTFYAEVGSHSVLLRQVAPNCKVVGPNPRPVVVDRGRSTRVTFDVACVGSGIAVTTRTSGPDSPDNFRLVVDALPPVDIAANGARTIGRLAAGTHTISLLAPRHCTVVGGGSVDVVQASYAEMIFDVTCTPVVRFERIAYAAYYADGLGPWIEVVDVDGTRPERLRRGDSPSWKRDGVGLLYSDATCFDDFYYDVTCSGGIGVVDPEIGTVEVLIGARFGFQPAWSPTRDEILFDRIAGASDYQLERVPISSPTMIMPVIVPGARSTSQGSWSPDGERIAFACRLGATTSDICITKRDGTALVRLTSDGRLNVQPAWSPDGTRIAYTAFPDEFFDGEIVVIDLASGSAISLGFGYEPAWSPDGSKLVFAADRGLFVMNSDGTDRRRLTTGDHRAPAWRPKR